MNAQIIPIRSTPLMPACFGVVCALHQRCARYHAVGDTQADPTTIGTCMTHEGYPLFEEFERVEAVAA